MLSGLADTWPARHKWTTDQLFLNYGDVAFKISQRGARKISMKFKDYVSYIKVQHDEDPLYIFDEKVVIMRYLCFTMHQSTSMHYFLSYFLFCSIWEFASSFNFFLPLIQFGEAAPSLLKDYCVPHLFEEDFFDILDTDKRPSYKWLIIGPERSGASWHVDPALTSAWNTLLCGRKR